MTKELIVLQGLPGSGKTTWAMGYLAANPCALRVSQDDLMMMLTGQEYLFPRAGLVATTCNRIVKSLMQGAESDDLHILVDNCNPTKRHLEKWFQMARDFGFTPSIVTFKDVPVEVCIERQAQRERKVPAREIVRMAQTMRREGIIQ